MTYPATVADSSERGTHWAIQTLEKRVDKNEAEIKEVRDDLLPQIKEAILDHKETCPVKFSQENLLKSFEELKHTLEKKIELDSSPWPKTVQGWVVLISTCLILGSSIFGMVTWANEAHNDNGQIKTVLEKLEKLERRY